MTATRLLDEGSKSRMRTPVARVFNPCEVDAAANDAQKNSRLLPHGLKTRATGQHVIRTARSLIVPILLTTLVLSAAGCHSGVPMGAQRLGQGRGVVSALAPDTGNVFVYDSTAQKTVYSGRIRQGDEVRVNGGAGVVEINGLVAADQPMGEKHEFQIYFR